MNIAVIGTGISGMACAWLLAKRHAVTVYEADDRLGGHSNTVTVQGADGPLPVDMGFIVYNETTYPNLTALLHHLGVPTQPSEMSFAVSLDSGALEYAGTDLMGLFAQRRNLVRSRFWLMLRDIARFYREAPRDVPTLQPDSLSLGDYLDARGYGRAFQEDHLLPMAAAIWSCRAGAVRDQPVAAFIRFCDNHGLLQVTGRPVWRTVTGGSRSYIERLTAPFADRIRLNHGVTSVRRLADGVLVHDATGETQRFDHVVIATHAGQALTMLSDADGHECSQLGSFGATHNVAVLHTDRSLMPRRRGVWASWNYLGHRHGDSLPCVTYWMNRLQSLPGARQLFVTLNPLHPPAADSVLHSETYEHPLLDAAAIAAQRLLWKLQGVRRTWFCGAYFGAGFHEDGLQAGLAVAEALGGVRRPWQVAAESGRIHVGAVPALEPA